MFMQHPDSVSEMPYILFVLQAEEFCDRINSGVFWDHVVEVQNHYPTFTICYVTNKLMKYINKRLVLLSLNYHFQLFLSHMHVLSLWLCFIVFLMHRQYGVLYCCYLHATDSLQPVMFFCAIHSMNHDQHHT
jgi:hypothetical protein